MASFLRYKVKYQCMKSILIILSLITLRCCWGPSDYQMMFDIDTNITIPKELNGTYSITTLLNEDIVKDSLIITFDNSKQFSGFSGCNRFFGDYTQDANKLKFGAVGSTKMLCKDANIQLIEKNLFDVLGSANIIFFFNNGFSLFKNKQLLLQARRNQEPPFEKLEYSAISRGFHKHISIAKNHLTIINNNRSVVTNKVIDQTEYLRLLEIIRKIDIKTISELQPPSKDHQFDGAALAHLSITQKKTTYQTQSFDHGKPPSEIADLVKEMLSLAENIE